MASSTTKLRKRIAKLVVHCSASPDSLDIGVKEIREWHTMPAPKGRGWSDIGYHAVIKRDGTVELGRKENGDSILEGKEIGAHVQGHNSDSLAVCLVGNKSFTPEQLKSLAKLLRGWLDKHGLKPSDVYGHYELDPKKTCPNINMALVRSGL